MGNDLNQQYTRETIRGRRDALIRERHKLREERQHLAVRDREIDRELADCRAAARLFGLTDIEFPPDEREEWLRARAMEHRLLRESAHPIESTVTQASSPKQPSLSFNGQVRKLPRIRDIILDQLKKAGSEGLKAAAIKRYIENTYSVVIHEKTVGMTLYRLSISKEKPVRREGQIWFLVLHSSETKNPGVGAPGQINRV